MVCEVGDSNAGASARFTVSCLSLKVLPRSLAGIVGFLTLWATVKNAYDNTEQHLLVLLSASCCYPS